MGRKVKFNNYSMMICKKYDDDWWEWNIFVDDDPMIIKSIKQVEYTLHPTFPDPIRTTSDRVNRFVLYSSVWGQFTINIEITFNDNTTINQDYFIRFSKDNWP